MVNGQNVIHDTARHQAYSPMVAGGLHFVKGMVRLCLICGSPAHMILFL